MLLVEQLLPLAHHAENGVVEYKLNYREIILCKGGKLCQVHVEAAVPCDVYDTFPGIAHLSADCCPKAVAHSAKTAGGGKGAGVFEWEVFRCPHLVLAYLRGDDAVPAGKLCKGLQQILGCYFLGVALLLLQGVLCLPFAYL